MKNTPNLGQLIHIVAAKTEEIERLEKTIDQVTTDKWDLEDANKRLKLEMEIAHTQLHSASELLKRRETELESARVQLKGIHELQQRLQSGSNEELFRAQRNVAAAEKEQERIENNYNHAQQTITQLNQTIELAKKEMEKLRKAQVNEEHLARKLVQLCNENNQLRADICNLKEQEKSACNIMAGKEPIPEIKKYQEQVARLLKERVDFDCQIATPGSSLCGGCISCQLQQAQHILNQTTENFKKSNDERDTLKTKTHEENQKLVQCLTNEVGHLKNILRPLRDAMGEIVQGYFWNARPIAKRALNDRMAYMEIHKLNSLSGDC